MHPYRRKRTLSLKSLSLTLLIAITPPAIGFTLLWFGVNSQQNEHMSNELAKSYHNFEQVFSAVHKVAKQDEYLAQQPCSLINPELKREVTRQLYIRSINTIRDNKIYCSSVLEIESEYQQVSIDMREGGKLVPGNVLTPNSAVLYIRYGNIMLAIDARLLVSFLESSLSDAQLTFIVDGRELHNSGWVYPQSDTSKTRVMSSQKWNFSVRAEMAPEAEWQSILANYLPVLLTFMLTGIMAATAFVRRCLCTTLTKEDLIIAIRRGEIVPWAQPIFDKTGMTLWGIEILARWKDREGKIIPPDQFIPLAEQSDIIIPLTHSLMRQTSKALSEVLPLLPAGFHVAFNISNKCCETDQLTELCKTWLSDTQHRLSLTLEMTERQNFQSSTQLNAQMKKLTCAGVKLAIDDFGTAGSNLDYLKHITFDYIKIDRSYVAGIGSSQSSEHIIDNILDLARRMKMGVIAEGIETSEQAEILAHKGADYFQGYLFSPPLPLDTFTEKYFRPLL